MSTQSERDIRNRYTKKRLRRFTVTLIKERDAELISWLESFPSANGAIISILRAAKEGGWCEH